MISKADVLLITAAEVESRAVLAVFQGATGRGFTPERGPDGIYLDLGKVNGARVCMALSGVGAGGVGGSQESVRKAIETLSPSAVVMVGIAFGVDEAEQRIGDVLVSEQLELYDLQRIGTDRDGKAKILLRGSRPPATPMLIDQLKVASFTWTESHVTVGLMLSGDKLVDNVDYRAQLLGFEPEAIGGEMEGAGLYVACQNKKVDWVLVKAICDWADGQKSVHKRARQKLAAHNAAAFVLHALQQAPFQRGDQPAALPNLSAGTLVATEQRRHTYSSLPSQPFFFGRRNELSLVADAISPDARTWGALVDGPGGIGKTALAIRAGHLAPTAHFDRKIFLSAKLRELSPEGPRELEDFLLPNYVALLTELARELGEDQISQIDPNERAQAVRRALAEVRALIVFDNVETFAKPERVRLYQFLSLLPPSCKAIVTSRRRADIDARVVRLDRLEREDALDLMAELANTNRHLQRATEQERGDLYEITNGNPLLIRWIVGQLGREGSRCRTIGEVCSLLERASDDNDPLDFIFGDLLDTFTECETAVLAALAHFTQPAKVKWVADVASIPAPSARTALEDLADRALLMSDDDAQTFQLLPLAASFIRRKRPEAVVKTGDRLTTRAYALAFQYGGENYDRYQTLESEWTEIASALPLLMRSDNDRLQSVCSSLGKFLDFSGRWDEELTLYRQAEEKALASGDLLMAGWRAYQIADMYLQMDQVASGLRWAARCTAHWKASRTSGTVEKITELKLRGLCHECQGEYSAAMEAYQAAVEILLVVEPESMALAAVLGKLGDSKWWQADADGAEADYREALRISTKHEDREAIAIYTGKCAETALSRREWANAGELAAEALRMAEGLGRRELIAADSRRLAESYVRQGQREHGLLLAGRAMQIYKDLGVLTELNRAQAIVDEFGTPNATP
jgi:nucleoside phosphorylase/tetratricopeptide (TPR) repeat protein